LGGQSEPLYFEHAPETQSTEFSAREGLNLLNDFCGTMTTDVTPETTRLFSNFVATLKKMDFNGIRRVYNQAMKDTFCKKDRKKIR